MSAPIDPAEIPFLAALPREVAADLATAFTRATYPEGACVFREGQSVDRVFLIVRGEVALSMDVPGRGAQRILTLGPGDLLGLSPLVGAATMSATATVVDRAELLLASGEELRRRCEADHHVGYHVMRQVAHSQFQRLVATRLQLLDLFRQEPVSRTGFAASP